MSQRAYRRQFSGIILSAIIVLFCCPVALTACSVNSAPESGLLQPSQSETTIPSPQVKYAPALTAEEVWKHIGEVRTVRYHVGNPYRSARGNVFLNEKQDYKTGFTTVIFATVAQTFGDPAAKYGYRTIEVTGLIRMYEGHPEIIVNIPAEIVIIK
jgi:hypothetical protein